MARYLVGHRNGSGGFRYYWQPSTEMRRAGWKPARLSDDPEIAASEANALNRQLDDWRQDKELRAIPLATLPVSRSKSQPLRLIDRESPTPGIYIIGTTDRRLKIGVSRNPIERLLALQTSNAEPLHLFFFAASSWFDAYAAERHSHALLATRRRAGEWFVTSPERALKAVAQAIIATSRNRC